MSKKITDTQLCYVAQGVVAGLDNSLMQASADLTLVRLKRILDGNLSKHEQAVYDTHLARAKSQVALATIRHSAEMTQLIPDAYAAIAHAVQNKDNPELAYRAARDILKDGKAPLHDSVTPGQVVNTQNNHYYADKRGQAAMDVFKGSVGKTTTDLMPTPLPPVGAPSKHIHISEAEVVGVDIPRLKVVEDDGVEGEPE